MSKPRDHGSRLIAEVFHGDWNDGASAEFARRAAVRARRRRRTRQMLAAVTASAAVLVIAFIALRPRAVPVLSVPSPNHQATATRGYEIISDAELLAQLRDRALIMVKQSTGRNEFVLVGE